MEREGWIEREGWMERDINGEREMDGERHDGEKGIGWRERGMEGE